MSGEFPFDASEPRQEPAFDLAHYLSSRDTREGFVIVEIGHRSTPIAHNQTNLTGGRAYIGIEAWIRDSKSTAHLQHLGGAALKNTFFIDHLLHPDMQPTDEQLSHNSEIYTAPYDPTTILPDNAADELFLSNVFGDPQVHTTPGRTELLLAEAKRLLAPNGTLVVRETLTPYFPIRAEKLREAGLRTVHRQALSDNRPVWYELEDIYNGGEKWAWIEPSSFYVFIKHAEDQTSTTT